MLKLIGIDGKWLHYEIAELSGAGGPPTKIDSFLIDQAAKKVSPGKP